jgi:hypothetical protein
MMISRSVYLLTYGVNGAIAPFSAVGGLNLRRRDHVVARSSRGLELAGVQSAIDAEALEFLVGEAAGEILRRATRDDEALAARLKERARLIFDDACTHLSQSPLPLQVVDVEVLLDAKQAILHYVSWNACDPRALMDALSDRHRLLIALSDLAPKPKADACGSGGCGSGGCGSGGCGSGGCSSCSSHHEEPAPAPPAGRLSLA